MMRGGRRGGEGEGMDETEEIKGEKEKEKRKPKENTKKAAVREKREKDPWGSCQHSNFFFINPAPSTPQPF